MLPKDLLNMQIVCSSRGLVLILPTDFVVKTSPNFYLNKQSNNCLPFKLKIASNRQFVSQGVFNPLPTEIFLRNNSREDKRDVTSLVKSKEEKDMVSTQLCGRSIRTRLDRETCLLVAQLCAGQLSNEDFAHALSVHYESVLKHKHS